MGFHGVSDPNVYVFWDDSSCLCTMLYWFFVFHSGFTIVILKAFDVKEFTSPEPISATMWLLELYGLSSSVLTYLLSFAFKSASTAQNSVIFVNVICMFLIMGAFIMSQFSGTVCHMNQGLQYVFSFLPAYSLGYGLVRLAFLSFLGEWASICDGGNVKAVVR
jgi:hypothetical protein